MDQCPSCGVKNLTFPICSRCNTDLSQILEVEKAAAHFRSRALTALKQGHRSKAQTLAERACFLRRSPSGVVILALIALADRDFATAEVLWREIEEMGGYTPKPQDYTAINNLNENNGLDEFEEQFSHVKDCTS